MLLKEQLRIIRDHQKAAPVRVTPIATALGVPVFKSFDWGSTISGMLKRKQGTPSGYAIYVNASHSPNRRRFTIAHEIGHFIRHENLLKDGIVEDALLRAEGLSNAIEAEANAFAADLLMPWNLVTAQQQRGVNTIEALADAFQVSRDAMSIRLLGVSYQRAREAGNVV
jgi:Zn-dependent peptidase ImmA (M78 family)